MLVQWAVVRFWTAVMNLDCTVGLDPTGCGNCRVAGGFLTLRLPQIRMQASRLVRLPVIQLVPLLIFSVCPISSGRAVPNGFP